ncbi:MULTISPECIES: sulfurtransferase TusA family protein [Haloimpatiens]|uniref:sulfurtransferase TusA family protein n=1 Tax=Haloimpatiens TaxID=1755832 RepID=UPI000C82B97A|nr:MULTISPECIES: sulfurtransferase TusA family protein [Haloimpatiens]
MQIDARGMSCPQPVLMAKKGIEQSPKGIEIIVDNNTAKGNVQRFLKNAGYNVDVKEKEEDFVITARK